MTPKKWITGLSLVLLLALAPDAFAQGKGKAKGKVKNPNTGKPPQTDGGTSDDGHGVTSGGGSDGGIAWLPAVDKVPEVSEKKYIFVYVRTPGELRESLGFQSRDLVTASKGEWSFVKMDLDPEDRWQKLWGITRAPHVVGCDLYRNDFKKTGSVSAAALCGVIKSVPQQIFAFKNKLRTEYAQAAKTFETDRSRGISKFVRIVLLGRKGYKEIENAVKRLNELGEEDFKRGELSETAAVENAIAYYEKMVNLYKTTPVGLKADLRIARLEHESDRAMAAIRRVRKVLKVQGHYIEPAHKAAEELLAEIVSKGKEKIDAAVAKDANEASAELRQISKDYAETEVARRANEELRHMK